MATYADGSTIAEVGDIVKCVAQGGSMFKPLSGDCSYKVVQLSGDSVYLEYPSEHGFLCSRFELIKRTGAATSPAKAEPLVLWPEEDKQPTFNLLREGDWFVWVSVPQKACIRHAGGKFAYLAKPGELMNGNNDEPVRRLRMIQPPKFEVI